MLFTLAILACNTSTPPAPGEPREAPMNPAAEGTDVWCPAEPRPLAGTWLAPKGDGPFPTALILVGARPWNRWGDAPDAPWGHYRDIAEALVAGGAAVLVFDKGGTGQTGGTTVNLSARVTEARAAVSCALAQPGADPQRFSLVGHSQGSVVATHATVNSSCGCPMDLASGGAEGTSSQPRSAI